MKNFYEVLGVEKNATDKEIKTAYRALARKFHPDTSIEPDAEEQMKAINEAYDCLSDADKRKKYDAHGSDFERIPTGSGGGFNFHFEHFDSGNEDIVMEVTVSAQDTLGTITVPVQYRRKTGPCKTCNGKGGVPEECSNCSGSGMHAFVANGVMFHTGICQFCRGKGYRLTQVCNDCSGAGLTMESVEKKIDIPYGSILKPIRVKGQGHHMDHSRPPGDFYIRVTNIRHDFLQFDNSLNCVMRLNIDPVEAIVGCQKTIETLDGSKHTIDIKQGSQRGTVEVLPSLGIPLDTNKRTDFIVVIDYQIPTNVSDKKLKHLKNYLKEA